MKITDLAEKAKKASILLAASETKTKDNALKNIARALETKKSLIIEANKKDLDRSQKENLA